MTSNDDVEKVSTFKPRIVNELKGLEDYNTTPTMTKITQQEYWRKLRSHDPVTEVHFVYCADQWKKKLKLH